MTEHRGPDTQPVEKKGGLGLEALSMNELPSAQPVAEGEVPRRGNRVVGLVLAVLAVAAFIVIGTRLLSNATPGEEAEARLRERLAMLPIWQKGVVMEVHYVAGDRVRLDFASLLSPGDQDQRTLMREAARETLLALREERPGRDLFVEGYQGQEEVLQGEYRQKSSLVGPAGEEVPDIAIRVKGDEGGGLSGAFSETSGSRR